MLEFILSILAAIGVFLRSRSDQALEVLARRRKRTSVQAPWQNGIAERWGGSCRREMPDHVIALNERQLRRPIRDYASYHDHARIHDSLEEDTPDRRAIERKPSANAPVISNARGGGLHHRYCRREAA